MLENEVRRVSVLLNHLFFRLKSTASRAVATGKINTKTSYRQKLVDYHTKNVVNEALEMIKVDNHRLCEMKILIDNNA